MFEYFLSWEAKLMAGISAKQKQILDCIGRSIAERGFPPSVRDICLQVGLKSPSTVQRHLNILEDAGYVRRSGGSSRSVTLTELSRPKEGVPIIGSVAAGNPILAVENIVGWVDYDPKDKGEHFALNIKGDSMVGAGILDGDTVIVKKQSTANNGEIIVALIGDEATCKRLKLSNGLVLLMPENDLYSPIDGSEALILGRVIALIRNY
jgi:repressor LexA